MISHIIDRIFGKTRKSSKGSGLPKEETEGKLCEDGTAALDDAMAAPSKEEKPDSALPTLLEAHFTIEEGRYRIGNHWLHEGITSGDIAMLCNIVNLDWITGPEDLPRGFYRETNNGYLIAESAIISKRGVIINKNVQQDDAHFTFCNFMNQIKKVRQGKP